jgi:hypothetical protein
MAMLPTVHRLRGRRVRLYYGALDDHMVSRIEQVDLDLGQPTFALGPPTRVLDVGAAGQFDDSGALPSILQAQGEDLLLFYVGFQRRADVPYTIFAGLARSSDGGLTFERCRQTPLFGPSPHEQYFRTVPWVLPAGRIFRAWYIGGETWVRHGERLLPSYELRTVETRTLERWPTSGSICLSPVGDEIGFGRPCVLESESGYRMWYSIRTRAGYHLGYAESLDGYEWVRKDKLVDMGPALADFDDEMQCYSTVIADGDRLVMFYCGNGYGRAGIGVAVLDDQ